MIYPFLIPDTELKVLFFHWFLNSRREKIVFITAAQQNEKHQLAFFFYTQPTFAFHLQEDF